MKEKINSHVIYSNIWKSTSMKYVNKVGIYSIKPHKINIKENVVTTV